MEINLIKETDQLGFKILVGAFKCKLHSFYFYLNSGLSLSPT